MRTAFLLIGAVIAQALWSALSARLPSLRAGPDFALVAIIFLVLRREPLTFVAAAVALGYVNGRQALAPLGLYESTYVLSAVLTYTMAGQLVGRGHGFFAKACLAASVASHSILFSLTWWIQDLTVSNQTLRSVFLPTVLYTGIAAWLLYPFMQALDSSEPRRKAEGLSWR